MSTTTPNKTGSRLLQDWIANGLAAGGVQVGAELNVTGLLAALITIQLVRGTGAAFTAGWPNVRIEGSTVAAGGANDSWAPVFEYQMAQGATLANTTLTAAVAAGATSLPVASGTGLGAGDLLLLTNASYSTCEIVRVKSYASLTVTTEEPIKNAYASGDAVRDQCEVAAVQLDLAPYLRVRAVIDNAGSGQAMNARVLCSTLDSLGTV